jgi:oxygen-independent coproporphyrinogen-3 oxidase
LGFNRLSIGVQSSQDEVLRFLGRLHCGHEGLAAVDMALASEFNVSADLMTAVPGQNTAQDLHTLAQTGVPHLSVYSLTIEPQTPFARRGVTVDQDQEADDFELAQTVLRGYGLERYEVSSHARPGFESVHNRVYWHGSYFLGLGPSAASFLPARGAIGERRKNRVIKAWLAGESAEVLPVSTEDYLLEMLMTGLRTRRGVELDTLATRTGLRLEDRYQPVLENAFRQGLLRRMGRRLVATEQGLLRLDGLLRNFFQQAD